MGSSVTEVVSDDNLVNYMTLPLTGMSPGDVRSWGLLLQTECDYNFMLDYDLVKPNTPPTITINTNLQGEEAEWELGLLKFTLTGNVIDPDGEDVEMELSICGQTATNFERQNLAWDIQVPIASCIDNDVQSPYEVIIKGTDESGGVLTLVANPNLDAANDP